MTAETYLGTVWQRAVSGTVSLTITSGPGGASIGGTTTATLTNGVASFGNVVLDKAGDYVLHVTSGNLIPGDSSTITVVAQTTATKLFIVQGPQGSVTAGSGFGVEVGAEDQFGNPTSFSGTVSLAIGNNPGNSTLSGTTTATASDGIATFSGLSLNKVGTAYTLTASLNGLTGATTGGFNVTPAAATQLVIPANGEPPTSVPAGQVFPMLVDAEDQFGNLQPSFTGSVSIAQPAGIGGAAPVNAVGGVATFSSLFINTAATYNIVAATTGLTSGTSSPITVTPLAAVDIAWVGEPPSSVFRNFPFVGTIDAQDKFGNTVTGFTGSVNVAFKANPGNATLGGTTSINATAGAAAFSGLTINAVGSDYTLVATGDGFTAVSNPINVTLEPAVGLKVSTEPPDSVQAGQTFNLAVEALDSAGDPDPDFTGSVTLAVVGPPGTNTLGGTTTVNAIAGVANFTGLTLKTVGSVTLSASSTGLGSVTTSSITVIPGAAAKLVAFTEPTLNQTAGVGFGFEVEALDASGNLVTNYTGTVTAALSPNPGNATLSGSLSAVASGGLATFTGLVVDKAGMPYTIVAAATGLTSGTTSDFDVSAAAPAELAITSRSRRRP